MTWERGGGPAGAVLSVGRDPTHAFSKHTAPSITLLVGLGVEGDAHLGRTVQHRSRVRRDPSQPNLRQVHLIHSELFDELAAAGYDVRPSDLGENVTTSGIDLLGLPTGTRLHLGGTAVVQVTGLRNPCVQIEAHDTGLLAAVLDKAPDGSVIRKAGVMSVVLVGGEVRPGDAINVELPAPPHVRLAPV